MLAHRGPQAVYEKSDTDSKGIDDPRTLLKACLVTFNKDTLRHISYGCIL